ncbi:TlpA family protein disulfide reductase [bacterium]|nr:TlpA family protein disulfide reductase [bacterium]
MDEKTKKWLAIGGMSFGGTVLIGLATLALVGVIVMRVLTASGVIEGYLPKPKVDKAEIGPQVNLDWTVQSITGDTYPFEAARGKVIFINFWATWCPPCRAEMPSIQRLYDELKDEKIRFFMVSNEDYRTVTDFITEKGYTFPVYTIDQAPPEEFITQGIPATFVISPDGELIMTHVGAAKWDDPEVVQLLRDLMP